MTKNEHARTQQLLQESLLPTRTQPRAELERDLWPAMLRRLDEPAMPVPWFDWALLAAVVVWLVLVPSAIPVLLYHL